MGQGEGRLPCWCRVHCSSGQAFSPAAVLSPSLCGWYVQRGKDTLPSCHTPGWRMHQASLHCLLTPRPILLCTEAGPGLPGMDDALCHVRKGQADGSFVLEPTLPAPTSKPKCLTLHRIFTSLGLPPWFQIGVKNIHLTSPLHSHLRTECDHT